jgi:peptidoglycan/xylan/chitin deacetylase (PgdA/CDA1 family)
LRGCFFLTTDFIGSEYVPWWDQQQRIETRWLTWDQARALRAAGHEIGSHTQTHVDLGKVQTDVAKCEVGGGNERLAKELGENVGLFAYPFGGRRNMSPENQAVISKLGLRCCVSAHGGYVCAGDDPFRLKRVNVSNWFESPYQFGFELVTGRLAQEAY